MPTNTSTVKATCFLKYLQPFISLHPKNCFVPARQPSMETVQEFHEMTSIPDLLGPSTYFSFVVNYLT